MFNNRQEDLTKVFDRTWKANHNNDVKIAREKERKFMDRMFNVKRKEISTKPLTPNQRVETLQGNMNNAFNAQRGNNINNIIKKWK